jgi:hypothetical protein
VRATQDSGRDFGQDYGRQFRPPKRRRRVWPYVLVVVLVVIGGLVVIADRVAVRVAEDRIADRLASERPFTERPDVTIHGLFFFAQAVRGTYDDIQVVGPGEAVGELGPMAIDASLHGVHLSLSDATSQVDRVPVDRLDLRLSFALGALAAASGIEGLTLTTNGDQIAARARVDLPVVGSVEVAATGRLVLTDGAIAAELTSINGVGTALPAAVEKAAREALAVTVPLDGLPFSSAATSIEVHGSSVQVNAVAHDVVLE